MSRSSGLRGAGHHVVVAVDRSWPVLAGVLVVMGGVSLVHAWGIAGVFVVASITCAFVSALVCGLAADFGVAASRGMRLAAVITVASLDMVGLWLLSPVVGSAAAAVGAVTSPLVTGRRLPLLSRSASRASQKTVDRRFARIVAELAEDRSGRAGT